MIATYLEELAGTLSFDPALSRRVAREVEDHLHEAIEADSTCDRREAERRAVARFGAPRALAVQFAAISLAGRTRRVGIAVVLAVVAVLTVMKARVAWYAAMQWTLSEEARPLGAIVLAIDRYAFWIAVLIGVGTLLYIGSRRVAAFPDNRYWKQHRSAVLLCAAATGALVVSVIGDGTLTMLQLGSVDLSAHCVVPTLSMVVEIACAAALIVLIAGTIRRARRAEVLLSR